MPKFKKNFKKSFKKRSKPFKKRDNNVAVNTLQRRIPRGTFTRFSEVMPLPPTLYTKFQYVGESIISSGAAGSTLIAEEYVFRMNSIYDPYFGATGAYNVGCCGYGQLVSSSGPYNRYKVNGVLLEIEGFDPAGVSTDNPDATELCAMVFNGTTSVTSTIVGMNAQQVEAHPYGVVKRISGSGTQRRYIKQYFPLWALYEMTKEQFRVDRGNTTAPYNGSPGTPIYLHVGICNRRGPTTATTLIVKVKITFMVELYDRELTNPT